MSSPISLPNTFDTKPDKNIILFSQYSLFPCQMNWLKNTSRQIVVAKLLYIRTVYMFQTSRGFSLFECYYFSNVLYEAILFVFEY